jgi:hypothetical protein
MTMQSEPSEQSLPDPIALALELAVYAPIGVAAYALDMGPDLVRTVVARGRAEVETRQEQVAGRLRHAKGAGEVAIAFGLPLVRRKVGERLSSLRPPATPATPPVPRQPPAPAPSPVATTPRVPTPPATNGHAAPGLVAPPGIPEPTEQLAIPGYDALSASQVVERLAGLSGAELDAVRQYETGHRRRRTILGKIEQLSV